jgi:hypothetical protein
MANMMRARIKLAQRTSQGHADFPFPPVAKIIGINHDRLGPSELGDQQHDKADGIDVSYGIQCEPSGHAWRRIPHFVCYQSMGIFMDDKSHEQAWNTGNEG